MKEVFVKMILGLNVIFSLTGLVATLWNGMLLVQLLPELSMYVLVEWFISGWGIFVAIALGIVAWKLYDGILFEELGSQEARMRTLEQRIKKLEQQGSK